MKTDISLEEEKRYEQLQLIALDYARVGESKELEKMIKAVINVNLTTHKEDSLLILASYNGNYETCKMLISYKARLNQRNQRGQTPLEGVCFKGYLNIVKLLVENKVEVNSKAIMYASIFGNIDIVKYLKSKKTNVSLGVRILEVFSAVVSYFKVKAQQ